MPFPERDELFARYQHLVRPIARSIVRKCPPDVQSEDLEQVGAIGLLAACDRYDPARAETFEGFCRQKILGAMIDWLRQREGHQQFPQVVDRSPDGDERGDTDEIPDPRCRIPAGERRIELAQAIGALEPTARHVLHCLYWDDMTDDEVGELLGVTGRWVRELESQALYRLFGAIAGDREIFRSKK